MSADFSFDTMQAQKQQNTIFKVPEFFGPTEVEGIHQQTCPTRNTTRRPSGRRKIPG